jgi:hypothetical protein
MIATPSIALAIDRELPHRDVLLDASVMRSVLSRLGTAGPVHMNSCVLVRVNYQVGRSLRAVYRVEVDGTVYFVASRMFRGAKSGDAFQRSRDSASRIGPLEGITHDGELETVFWVVPNDRKIESLATVLDATAPLPGVESKRIVRKLVVAYAPEKSATLACDDENGGQVAYAKVTAAQQAARDFATYRSLRAQLDSRDSRLRLPEPLGYSAAERMLALEPIRGRRMAESEGDGEVADLERLGGAVAAFHDLAVSEGPAFERFSAAHLQKDAAIVRTIRPDVWQAVEHLAARLIATASADTNLACLHGDLHPKNAILSDDRVALIDVEDVAIGPAAADIGSLIASLIYRRDTGRLSRDACRQRAHAFCTGYETVRALPTTASLQWHTAAALFVERATRAITRIRPLGLEHMPALLVSAERLLDTPRELQ